MVLQLILHTTPHPLGERVIRDGVSCRPELAVNELGILIEKDLLALSRKRKNDTSDMSHVTRKKNLQILHTCKNLLTLCIHKKLQLTRDS